MPSVTHRAAGARRALLVLGRSDGVMQGLQRAPNEDGQTLPSKRGVPAPSEIVAVATRWRHGGRVGAS